MLLLEERWGSHPGTHPGLNADHPLAKYCVELSLADGGVLRSLVGVGVDLGATPVERVISASGPALRSATVSSPQYMDAPVRLSSWSTAWTLYARVKVGTTPGDNGTNVGTARYIYALWASATNAIGITKAANSPGSQIGAFINLGGNRAVTAIAVSNDTEYDCFISKPAGAAVATLNIVGVGSSTSLSITDSVTISAPFVRHGNNISTSAPGDKTFIVGGFFQKELTEAERLMVARDPWALFAEQITSVPVAAAGGGASVTLPGAAASAAAGSVTAAGGASASLTDAASAAATGVVAASGGAAAALTGAATAAAAGQPTATGGASGGLLGAAAEAAAGAVTASAGGGAAVTLPGAASTASAGNLSATGGASVALTGAAAVVAAGDITVSTAGGASVVLTGASASAAAGIATATGGAAVQIAGAWATAYAGIIAASDSLAEPVPERSLRILAESRALEIQAEARQLRINPESRQLRIDLP